MIVNGLNEFEAIITNITEFSIVKPGFSDQRSMWGHMCVGCAEWCSVCEINVFFCFFFQVKPLGCIVMVEEEEFFFLGAK